jgi:hypothetical protein
MAARVLAAPSEPEEQRTPTTRDVPVTSAPYTEATPSSDCTLSNVSSSIEEILAEVGVLQDTETRSKRRPCACSTTVGAYGGRQGTAFVDITTNSCDAEITEIWVRSALIVDAIQVHYNFSDGHSQTMARRGGSGGTFTHITVPQGGKIIGIFGGITTFGEYGTVITQLRLLIVDGEDSLQIYGPYGTKLHDGASTFAVYGDIKSMFGYHRQYLDGLGVYYVPWGICGSPCA